MSRLHRLLCRKDGVGAGSGGHLGVSHSVPRQVPRLLWRWRRLSAQLLGAPSRTSGSARGTSCVNRLAQLRRTRRIHSAPVPSFASHPKPMAPHETSRALFGVPPSLRQLARTTSPAALGIPEPVCFCPDPHTRMPQVRGRLELRSGTNRTSENQPMQQEPNDCRRAFGKGAMAAKGQSSHTTESRASSASSSCLDSRSVCHLTRARGNSCLAQDGACCGSSSKEKASLLCWATSASSCKKKLIKLCLLT